MADDAREALGREIMEDLLKAKMILTWYRDRPEGWFMASGLWSPFYLNIRVISSYPELYRKAAIAINMLLGDIGVKPGGRDKVVGIAMAGIPLANAVTFTQGIPSLYTRKLPEEVKTPEDVERYMHSHGNKALVEGDMESGDRLVLVDDLVTRFDSKLLAIGQINEEVKRRKLTNIETREIVVLLDREQGGVDKAREMGYTLRSFIPFASKGIGWLKGSLSELEYSTIVDYLKDNKRYQDKGMQEQLARQAKK
ncbi:MAG TPA: hypothetical protein VL945_01180 [Candidatus Saccharimonadales bacterium]|nr:hypothetical protein [Candidatus Saccharimonadales bacterium]